MSLFWVCWGIDVFIGIVGLYFFLTGIETATPGSAFFRTWAMLFLVMGGIIGGSYLLKAYGFNRLAVILASPPVLFAALYVLWILMIIITKPRWN